MSKTEQMIDALYKDCIIHNELPIDHQEGMEIFLKRLKENLSPKKEGELTQDNLSPLGDFGNGKTLQDEFDEKDAEIERLKKGNSALPSAFQIGDKVSIRLRPFFVVDSAEVVEVHFTEGKVYYDLEVEFKYGEGEKGSARIGHVDAAIISEL